MYGVAQEVSEDTGQQMLHALSLAVGDNLRHSVNRSVTREVTRALTISLTESLTKSIADKLSVRLHQSMTYLTTHKVTRPLIPLFTHSLAVILGHSMTREPQYDYFCYYCFQEPKMFCNYCWQNFFQITAFDYYTGYYAAYYSKYYDSFYGEVYSEKISQDYIQQYPLKKEINVMEGEAPSADGTIGPTTLNSATRYPAVPSLEEG